MKHKHYEMIVAQAENTTLVKFVKLPNQWVTTTTNEWNLASEYFLCLPQHNKDGQCLHWLNGGDVQDFFDGEWTECAPLSKTINTDSENSLKFSIHHMFMNEEFHFRIKPKKEKRWIAVLPNGRVSGWHDEDPEKLKQEYNEDAGWQIIPIEVEV